MKITMITKHLIPILFFLFPLFTLGQKADPMSLPIPTFDTIDGKRNYFYEEIIQFGSDTISKNKIYTAAKFAVVSIFNSSKNIVQLDDSTNGNLIAKVYTTLPDEGTFIYIKDNVVYYSLTIRVKNGAYKYRIENIHKAFAIQKTTSSSIALAGTNYYDFELNNYDPNRHKGKKLKIETMTELNTAHNYLQSDIKKLKKAIENYLNGGSEKW